MNTEKMITELKAVAEKHKNDTVYTFQTNITAMCRDIISKLGQLAEYEAIGTVEEYREARDRQISKKPNIWGDGSDNEGNIIYDTYDCPNCGKSYEVDYHDYKHCPECGQAIDRSDIIG